MTAIGCGTHYHIAPPGGLVHVFSLNSDCSEPNGNTAGSVQGAWLQAALAASTAPWKLVIAHHAPYSSCTSHGSQAFMQWGFEGMGAHAVLSGHDHTYERVLMASGMPYFVNGIGGQSRNSFGTPIMGEPLRAVLPPPLPACRCQADTDACKAVSSAPHPACPPPLAPQAAQCATRPATAP